MKYMKCFLLFQENYGIYGTQDKKIISCFQDFLLLFFYHCAYIGNFFLSLPNLENSSWHFQDLFVAPRTLKFSAILHLKYSIFFLLFFPFDHLSISPFIHSVICPFGLLFIQTSEKLTKCFSIIYYKTSLSLCLEKQLHPVASRLQVHLVHYTVCDFTKNIVSTINKFI